jgi:glycine C-acetyltransferase
MAEIQAAGMAKGPEAVVTEIIRPHGDKGPRVRLEGYGDRPFLRMNSNSYLGLSIRDQVIRASERRRPRRGPLCQRHLSAACAT